MHEDYVGGDVYGSFRQAKRRPPVRLRIVVLRTGRREGKKKKGQPCSRGMRSVGPARKKGSRTTFVILNGDLVSADSELEKKTHPVFLGDAHAYPGIKRIIVVCRLVH